MESNKLEISGGRPNNDQTPHTGSYKQIPDEDMEDREISRPAKEADGADEKMLPDDKVGPNSNISLSEVKFTSGDKTNGDAKLDIGEAKTSEFVGMTKEELMKYANDPFWVRLRWVLFILFWACWVGMLVGAVMIIINAPKCAPPEPKTWWEEGPLAEVDTLVSESDMKSFEKAGARGFIVPYPQDTYESLNKSKEFVEFLQNAKKNKFNVIVELSPSTSSRWFDQSENKDEDFADYYIWSPKDGPELINNWLSEKSSDDKKIPAWVYSEKRKQNYLAPNGEPMLNFRSPKVVEEFSKVIKDLINAGAMGVRLGGVPTMLVDEKFENETISSAKNDFQYTQDNYHYYTHYKTLNVHGLGEVLKTWKDIVRNQTDNQGVLMLSDDIANVDAYKVNGSLQIDLPRGAMVFQNVNNATKLKKHLEIFLDAIKDDWPVWRVSDKQLPLDVIYPVAYLLKGSTIIESNYTIAPKLMETRKSDSIIYGSQEIYSIANNTVFAYVRMHSGHPGFIVALNPSEEAVTVNFPEEIQGVPDDVTTVYVSNAYNTSVVSLGTKTDAHSFEMLPKSSAVLSFVPKKE